jgi:2,4-didehydro-3-deoxy-L-rhamnonate hydrolase
MGTKTAQMILLAVFGGVAATCVAAADARPFKVGTFDAQGRMFVGAVVDDSLVIDLGAAAAALKKPPSAAPRDMRDLIARYESGVRDLIVAAVAGATASGPKPAYAFDLKKVRTLAPVMPQTMMNAAVNYFDHANEMGRGNTGASAPPAPAAASVPGLWERKADDKRWNPYLFLKAPAAIIASGEAIRLPPAREQIDYECEMAVVIGRVADHVPVAEARAHIFGYSVHLDVSDRGGQRNERFGSDWLVGKSHATFAPLGPYIAPKEFVADPQKLKIEYTLNGKLMQDADTSLMVHSVDELVSYASNILPLQPGDVINTGTPAGVGAGRKPPVFLKAGDRSSCTYASVGTLVNSVVASK